MVQSVLDPHYPQGLRTLLTHFDQVLVDTQKLTLGAGIAAANEIAHFETHQVDLSQHFIVEPQLVFR